MPRESSKCRQWEKERRDRFKDAFTQLAKLLPCYDPSVNICKIDILQKAAINIEELQDKIKKILSSDTEKKTETGDVIKKLQDRVKKLLVRNEQLSNLLRDAGIAVPSAYGAIKKIKKEHRWSRKISPEQAKLLQKSEMEKENMCSNLVEGKKRKTKHTADIPSKPHSTIPGVGQKRSAPKRRKNKKTSISNCYILMSQPSNLQKNFIQQYYLITPQSSNKDIVKPASTNTGMFPKPIVTSKSRTSKNIFEVNSTPTLLNPGALVLSNGAFMRVLPYQSQSCQPALSNLFINSAIGVGPKKFKTQTSNCNKKFLSKDISQTDIRGTNTSSLPFIQPKYCLTKTTQINKVPIPALTSRYANNDLLLNKSSVKHNEEKLNKTNKTEEIVNFGLARSDKLTKKISNKRKIEVEDKIISKKGKNASKNNSANDNISGSSSNNTPNTTDSVNKSITETCNETEVIINKDDAKIEGNKLMKESITDSHKNKEVLEANVIQKVAVSEDINITEELVNNDDIEKNNEKVNESNVTHVPTSIASAPIITTSHDVMKSLDLNLSHSELSNDIFASLQVPSGCQNPESTSPTAAFLLAFPLVSSGVKVTEVIEEENSDSQRGTPTLLQIGTMETTKSTQSHTETITSNFLNLDNFSFLPTKDVCSNFYTNYSSTVNQSEKPTLSTTLSSVNKTDTTVNKSIYVNIKSPCLPSCVTESVKENCNIFDLKSANSSKGLNNVDSSEKRVHNEKVITNTVNFNSHAQSSSKTIDYPHSKDQIQKTSDQKSRHYTPTYSTSTCNFNYRNETTKPCTSSFVNISRNYTNPLYTNCTNYNYNYHPDTNFNQTYYKNIPRNETKAYYPLNYENYPEYRKNETSSYSGYYETPYVKESKNNNVNKAKTQNKLPINWMTTPDTRLQNSECLLNSFSKGDFGQSYPFSSYVTSSSTYFTSSSTDTTNVSCIMETKKSLELPSAVSLNSHQKVDTEDKQFSWSPTKLPHFLDHPHNLVTSTLPMLVGDLALGNTLTFGEQKSEYKHLKENKDIKRSTRSISYENQNNFLSVSQLVDHGKPENIPAKISTRRNSGGRSKNTIPSKVKKSNKQDSKNAVSNCGVNAEKICERVAGNYNVLASVEVFPEQKSRSVTKNTSSNYSAEALIGIQMPEESDHKRYPSSTSKSLGTSSFLAENIIPYFPPVDLAQDGYMSQGQNYQTNNFTHNICTCHNNTYASNSFIYAPSTITSTYLPTGNFEAQHHDYLPDNFMSNTTTKEKHYNVKHFNNRQQPNKDDKNTVNSICQNNFKKSKKKQNSDTGSTLASFEFPFISLPGSNNSPILPDDFHCHTNFLPPTTPFSCKNSLYPKQNDLSSNPILPLPSISRSSTQHPEISPINSVGTSLTNFNLSTIFPEINKQGPMTEMYPEARGKDHSKSCTSASPHVPFNTEPKYSFST